MSERVRFPERPALPVSLYALVAVVLVERWTLAAGSVPVVLAAAVAAVTVALVVWVVRAQELEGAWGAASCVACAVTAALMTCGCALWLGHAFAAKLAASSVSSWAFEVVEDSTPTLTGYRCRARAHADGAVSGDVWLSTSDSLRRGTLIGGVGRFRANTDDDYGRANRQQGVWGTVTLVREQLRGRRRGIGALPLAAREAARSYLCPEESDERAVLAGIVLGDRTEMRERGLDKLFATCGVAHLVAVSGSHIAVVGAILAKALEHTGMGPKGRLAAQLVVTLLFVALCGAPASAVRAWAMSAVASAGTLAGRRLDGTSSVCLVALAMALIDPSVSGQLGFLLSVICVVSLCVYAPYATAVVDVAVPDVRVPSFVPAETRIRLGSARHGVVSSLGASLVAQAASLPLVGSIFARMSLVAPLSTLLVGGLLSAALGLGLVSIVLVPVPVISHVTLLTCDVLLHAALEVLRVLSRVPFASVPVTAQAPALWAMVLLGAAVVFVMWPRPSRAFLWRAATVALTVTFVVVAHWRYLAPARICVLDVGQGDAILIQDGSAAILVDAGPPGGSVVEALAREHVLHLDAVVVTHLHDDHYGGVGDLAGSVPVDKLLVAAGVSENLPEELTHLPCREVSYHNRLQVGGFTLCVVWPRVAVTGLTNPDSLELAVSYDDKGKQMSALLTGDAEQDETGAVIVAGEVGDIDILKVGHHGSEVSLTSEQARALRPEVAVASAGEGNRYGHPSEECVDVLTGAGARFLCTKDVGDVELRPERDGVAVRTSKSRR